MTAKRHLFWRITQIAPSNDGGDLVHFEIVEETAAPPPAKGEDERPPLQETQLVTQVRTERGATEEEVEAALNAAVAKFAEHLAARRAHPKAAMAGREGKRVRA